MLGLHQCRLDDSQAAGPYRTSGLFPRAGAASSTPPKATLLTLGAGRNRARRSEEKGEFPCLVPGSSSGTRPAWARGGAPLVAALKKHE